jgi:hypothetical protein
MTKEGKTVTLAALTVFMFGLTSFLQFKQVIFPFPLNELIFFIATIVFAKDHLKNNPKTMSLILVLGLFHILSLEFYWNIFFSNERMLQISQSSITDYFKIGYYIGIITWIITTFNQVEVNFKKYLSLLPITLVLAGSILNEQLTIFYSQLILFLGYGSVVILLFTKIKQFPLLYLWVLLFILEFTKVWSLASSR